MCCRRLARRIPAMIAALLLILLCLASVVPAAELRPNILFVLADDLGPNDLACYGRREHRTPNLDRLAGEGSRFTCAYVAQPICSPSRAAILTGKAPARLHLTTYLPGRPDCPSQKLVHPVIEQQLPLAEKTLAECLHDTATRRRASANGISAAPAFCRPTRGSIDRKSVV